MVGHKGKSVYFHSKSVVSHIIIASKDLERIRINIGVHQNLNIMVIIANGVGAVSHALQKLQQQYQILKVSLANPILKKCRINELKNQISSTKEYVCQGGQRFTFNSIGIFY